MEGKRELEHMDSKKKVLLKKSLVAGSQKAVPSMEIEWFEVSTEINCVFIPTQNKGG